MVAAVIAAAGMLGSGYCDYQVRFFAPLAPHAEATVARDYKGQVRYVDPTLDRICSLSEGSWFGGTGLCLLIGTIVFLRSRHNLSRR